MWQKFVTDKQTHMDKTVHPPPLEWGYKIKIGTVMNLFIIIEEEIFLLQKETFLMLGACNVKVHVYV